MGISCREYENDEIERFFEYGLYIPDRTIYIGAVGDSGMEEDAVNHSLAARVIKSVHILESISDSETINIILNNPGGDQYHGLAIYDVLINSNCVIVIKVYGHAMSMGSIILQAGDERWLSKNTTLMIHDGSLGLPEMESKSAEKWGEESKRLRELGYKIYHNRMKKTNKKMTIKKIKEMCSVDTILPASKAVEYGLADGIISG